MLFKEDYVRRSLARVCNNEGVTLGTAFFILAAEGVALTCHHLVETNERIVLDCGDGRCRKGLIAEDDRFPEIDVAIVRCADDTPAQALPIEADHLGITRFWTKGFHFYGQNVTDALPASGQISGSTDIEFSTPNGRNYRLSGVLVLKDDVFDSGLSGAPVLDPDTGVVFALVNAKFKCQQGPLAGFALPLSRVKEHSPKLTSLFDANRDTVPRYGRFLNHLGAAEICRRQREAVIDRLVRRGIFLPDLYCERAKESIISDFFESGSLILPIIGNAGVGKTMLLAELARRAGPREVVLLLGLDLREEDTDLSVALTSQLRKVAAQPLGNQGDASLVVTALRNSGRQLTVLLDGLNEVPTPLSGVLKGWIEHTITWLEETDSRLVVSSGPEFWKIWSELFPRELIFSEEKLAGTRPAVRGIQLGDFSEEEAEKARKRYGLRGSLSARDIQHPMMARIYWEMQTENMQAKVAPTARYRAWERFIKMKCGHVARAFAPSVVRPYVESALKRVGRAALTRGGFEVEEEDFWGLFVGNPHLGNQFMQEGIVTRTSSGVRFVSDEIAGFIQGQSLDLEMIVKRFSGEADQPKLTTGAVVFAILRFDEEDHGKWVHAAIRAIVDAHARDDDDARILCENSVVQLLPQIRQPERFATEMQAMAQQMTRHKGYCWWNWDFFDFRHTIGGLEASLKFKLDLLRLFLPKEHYYEFEHHHWGDPESYVSSSNQHTATILGELIKSDPQPAFEIITDWLADRTRFHQGFVTVGHAAKALLFYYRHLAFDRLCELLARSTNSNAKSLLAEIAKEDPRETGDVCLRWAQGSDPLLQDRAAHLCWYIADQTVDNMLEDKLYGVFSRVIGLVNADVDLVAKKGIGRLKKYRHTVIEELFSRWKQGDPQVDGSDLAGWAETHFDQVVAAVTGLIKAGKNQERCSCALSSLCCLGSTREEKDKLIDLLDSGVSKGLLDSSLFRLAIERMLYQVDSESTRQRMANFARRIISGGPKVRLNLMYFAANEYAKSNHQAKLQDDILELLVKHETDTENQSRLILRLADRCLDRPDPLSYFLRVGELMGVERFYHVLLGAAFWHKHFAATLADWLASDRRLSALGPTQTFLDRVRSGEEPGEAARSIIFGYV